MESLKELKELNLSCNSIQKIENLTACAQITDLNLENNLITNIENLPKKLIKLKIGSNKIEKIQGLD
jgi:Leucine-rich repeat (LRR) protein